LKILWIEADQKYEINTSRFRVEIPASMMSDAGHECFVSHRNLLFPPTYHPLNEKFLLGVRETFDKMKWADVVVIERLITNEIHPFIKWLQLNGKKVWCSFDDAYHLMPLDNIVMNEKSAVMGAQGVWRGGKKALGGHGSVLNEFRHGLSLCDGAMVPSRVLVEDYRQYNPNTQFIPNFLHAKLWDNPPKKPPDVITIGWGGSTHHTLSWKESGIIPALSQICRDNPRVVVHLQPAYPDIVKLFDGAKIRYVTGSWQSLSDWVQTLSSFMIGVCPLSGEYDRRRSSLRAQEFGMSGVPWVGTDDAPYKESEGGIRVSNKSKDWFRAIESLIKDKALYQRLSEEGRTWAKEFNAGAAQRYEEVFGL
jgi:hypothetical protein